MTKTLSKPALLMTESKQDYQALQASLEREIMPRSFVESMYVADIAALIWEILRLRRCKSGIINNAFDKALQNLRSHTSTIIVLRLKILRDGGSPIQRPRRRWQSCYGEFGWMNLLSKQRPSDFRRRLSN
jgi:hypothetical protein